MANEDFPALPPGLREEYQKIYELRQRILDQRSEMAAAMGEENLHAQQALAKIEASRHANQELLNVLELSNIQRVEALATAREQLARLGEERASERQAFQEKIAFYQRVVDLGDDEVRNTMKNIRAKETQNAQEEKRIRMATGMADQMASLVGISKDWRKSTFAALGDILKSKNAAGALGAAMREKLSPMNIAYNILDKIKEATVKYLHEQDRAISSFKRASGAGESYNNVIVKSHLSLRTYGVSAAEASRVTSELYGSMANFSGMTEAAQISLSKTVAFLERFNVNVGQVTKSMNLLSSGLGMSSAKVNETTRNLFGLNKALGTTPDIIFTQFAQASSQLSAHGGKMIQVFEGMAAAAKATGAEMSTLLAYTAQFDVFTQGAQAVGKMNALLGGPYLNTVQMINAEEGERIRLTLQAMQAAGKSWTTMGKHEKMAFANAAGIRDMAQANNLFNTTLQVYDIQQAKAKAAAISQKEFERVTRDAMAVVEKYGQILKNLALDLSKLLEPLGDVAEYILELQDRAGGLSGAFLGLAAVAIPSLVVAIGTLLTVGFGAIAVGVQAMGSAIGNAGLAATKGSLGMLAFGASVALVGAGIGVATTGIAFLIDAFRGLFSIGEGQMDKFIEFLYRLGPAGVAGGAGLAALMAGASQGPGIRALPSVVHSVAGTSPAAVSPGTAPAAAITVATDPRLTAVLRRNTDVLERIAYRLEHPIAPNVEIKESQAPAGTGTTARPDFLTGGSR